MPPALRHLVHRDLRHHLDGPLYTAPLETTLIRLLRAYFAPEFRVVLSYRIYSRLHQSGWRRLGFFLYQRAKKKWGCDLHPEATIGEGLRIAHCSDIVVGPGSVLKSDVELFNGVTLGNRLRRDGQLGMPTVRERVMVGAGAKILGEIEIGAGARIGANAVVLESVPPERTAVGIPARIV